MVFPTEEEAEYPQGLVEAYAKAIKEELKEGGMLDTESSEARLSVIAAQLNKYHRMEDPELKQPWPSESWTLRKRWWKEMSTRL